MREDDVVASQAEKSHTLRCDFCNLMDVMWEFECASFDRVYINTDPDPEFKTFTEESVGNWFACDTCNSLIGKQQWDALAERSANAIHDPEPMTRDEIVRSIKMLHVVFQRLRTGKVWRTNRVGIRCNEATGEPKIA